MATIVVKVNSIAWEQAVKDGTAVYIGRANPRMGFKGSRWANPFRIAPSKSREECIESFTGYMRRDRLFSEVARIELKGKVLGCWCAPLACHGDLLARLADMSEEEYQDWLGDQP